jgi:PAS domain S-box-containing protein
MGKRAKLTAYLIASLFFISIIGVEIVLIKTDSFSKEIIYFLSLISIVVASVFGGLGAGIFSTVLSSLGIGYSYIFIPADRGQIWIFLGGILISLLIGQVKKEEENAIKISETSSRNEHYLKQILDSLYVFTGITTPEGTLLQVNPSSIAAAKLRSEWVLNKNIKNTYWWSYSKQSRKKIKEAVNTANKDQVVRYDTPIRIKNDQYIIVDLSITPLKNKQGKIENLMLLAMDVNQRTESLNDNLKLCRALKKQKKITEKIISDIPGVVWELNRKSKTDPFYLSFASHYIETMLGYKISDLNNDENFWQEMIFDDDRKSVLREIELVYRKQKQRNCRFRCISADGKQVWVESRFSADVDENGKSVGVGGILFDISDKIRSEKIKNDFVNIASHEIKTPLTTIKAFSQIVEKRISLFDRRGAIKYLTRMEVYIDKLNQLINEFMEYSKFESGKMEYFWEVIDIDKLVREVVSDMQLIYEDHKLLVSGRTDKKIVGDKNKISQLIINLISNGVKYSPDTNKIDIEIKNEQDAVIISFEDYGIGIDSTNTKKIFDKFFRVQPDNNKVEGAGLGLYICKEIIKKHHGKIWVDSKPDKGSIFYISFPLAN